MDTVEHQGEDQGKPLPPEYLHKVIEACPISDEALDQEGFFERAVIGLLAQQNLLLDKMCNLLMISTGLMDHDTSIDITDIQGSMKETVGRSLQCPNCSITVVPDQLGYCPKCQYDLRKLMMEREG